MTKIKVGHIIVDHFNTLCRFDTGKRSITDIIVFFIIPLTNAIILVALGGSIMSILGDLLKAIAIFSAFLFNMLAIVNSTLNKESITHDQLKLRYAKEIHANLSFEILLGIVIVVLLLLQSLTVGITNNLWVQNGIELTNIFLIGVFFLTLLMCLNRVYILLRS